MSVYIENKIHNLEGLLPSFHLKGIQTITKQAIRKVDYWLERSKQRRELAGLDEHMLEDIGYTREQAEEESARPFWK